MAAAAAGMLGIFTPKWRPLVPDNVSKSARVSRGGRPPIYGGRGGANACEQLDDFYKNGLGI